MGFERLFQTVHVNETNKGIQFFMLHEIDTQISPVILQFQFPTWLWDARFDLFPASLY